MGREESVSKGKLADSSVTSIPNSTLKGSKIIFTNHIPFLFRLDLLVFSCSKSQAFILLGKSWHFTEQAEDVQVVLLEILVCCMEQFWDQISEITGLLFTAHTAGIAQQKFTIFALHTLGCHLLEQSTNHKLQVQRALKIL